MYAVQAYHDPTSVASETASYLVRLDERIIDDTMDKFLSIPDQGNPELHVAVRAALEFAILAGLEVFTNAPVRFRAVCLTDWIGGCLYCRFYLLFGIAMEPIFGK